VQTFSTTLAITAPGATGTAGAPPVGTGGFSLATGSIAFTDTSTSTVIGTATVTGPGTYQITTSTLGVGTHPITAKYLGDTNYATSAVSNPALSEVITKAPTNPIISSVPANSSSIGQTVLFSITFSTLNNTPLTANSTIDLYDTASGGTVCHMTVTAQGIATCTVTATSANNLGQGTHTLSVQNLNDPNYILGTITPYPFSVGLAATTTVLTSSVNPSIPGQAVTFTASITVNNPGAGTIGQAGQSVNFIDLSNSNQVLCASVPVIGTGVETCTYTFPSGTGNSTHNIQAVFSGDTQTPIQLAQSQSNILAQVIGKPAPGVTLVITVNPAGNSQLYGDPISLTGILTGANNIAPTGQLQYNDGNTTLGVCNLVAVGTQNLNQATCTFTVTPPTILAVGNHAFNAAYVPGNDPNYSAVASNVVNFTIVKANSTVSSIAVAPTSSGVYSQSMTFTVTVYATDSVSLGGLNKNIGVPTGTVTFSDGTTILNGSPVTLQNVNGNMTATITVNTLSVATHTITATYSGDPNFNSPANPSTVIVPIGKASTSTQITSIVPSSASVGQVVTITAKVTPVAPAAIVTNLFAAGDTITFYDGAVTNTPLGTATIDGTGTATLQVSALTIANFQSPLQGTHIIYAVFTSSDPNYLTSTGSSTMTIGKVTPTVSVISSVNPSVFNQVITFTVTITPPYNSSNTVPTGTVVFSNNGNPIGTATVQGNVGFSTATLVVPSTGINPIPVGPNNVISAAYSGDQNYNQASSPTTVGSTPAPLVQVVNKANTTTTLTSSIDSAVVGQPMVLTATITVNLPGAAGPTASTAPSGTVMFYSNIAGLTTSSNIGPVSGVPLQTIAGQNGINVYQAQLQLSTSQLATLNTQGQVQFTAYYVGDGNFLNSTSNIVTEAVSRGTVAVQVTTNLNPAILGQPTTFTAVVTPIAPATGVPTGLIQFFDNNVNLNGGTGSTAGVQMVNGTATFTTVLGVGLHGISVVYSGDNSFQGNNTAPINELVNPQPSSLTLSASSTTAVASQPLTFTAVISGVPVSGQIAGPSGQVNLVDGSNVIAFGSPNAQGGVTFTCPGTNCGTLSVGVHNLQAMYPGDGNWTKATSSFITVTVTPAVTSTTITSSAAPSVYGQPVTFTVNTLAQYPATSSFVAGTVQLFDNTTALGNAVSVNNGQVTITMSNLAVGTHNIIAAFQGGVNFGTSSSAALTQIVNKAPTATTLAVNPTSTESGSAIVLTAVVAVPSPGAGNPTGTVVFSDATSNSPLGSVQLTQVGGVFTASLTTNKENQASAPRLLVATYSGDTNFATSASPAQPETVNGATISVMNAASYMGSNFAPGSAAAIFVNGIVTTTLVPTTLPLPQSLAGVTVTVTDSQGTARQAALYFISPTQINFVVPDGSAVGLATVMVNNTTGGSASGVILVTTTAPGIFTFNQNGLGVAAAEFVDVNPQGTATRSYTGQYNTSTNTWVPVALTMNSTDTYALELYGTGLKYANSGQVTATINGQKVNVLYAGAQPQYPGLDQIDLQLPASLSGAGGPVTIVISVNGQAANSVTVNIN
jgi:hypothetical protein